MLAVRSGFCRACGRDHDDGDVRCSHCGWDVVPLPAQAFGAVGVVHSVRRGLRRRLAVRVGDHEGQAVLLVEGGDRQSVPHDALPDVAKLAPTNGYSARSSPGRLLQLAAGVSSGATKYKWQPADLHAAAVAVAGD